MITVYTDGSYWQGKYAYAYLVLDVTEDDTLELHRISGICPEEFRLSNNIGAEVCAAVKGIQWCHKNVDDSVILIVHDYEGIGEWALSQWEAKSPIARRYVDFIHKCHALGMKINFQWVRGHGDDSWNIEVDKMASAVFSGLPKHTLDMDKPKTNDIPLDMLSASKGFMVYLETWGYKSEAHSVNSQVAKFTISKSGLPLGYGNIYDTKKGPSFKSHEVTKVEIRVDLERYWEYYQQ